MELFVGWISLSIQIASNSQSQTNLIVRLRDRGGTDGEKERKADMQKKLIIGEEDTDLATSAQCIDIYAKPETRQTC